MRNAHIIRVRFALSLFLFSSRATVVKFPLSGRDNVPLSPSNFTLSLAPRTQMRVVFIFPSRPSLFYSQFSFPPPPRHPSSPRPTLVRSEPLRLHAGQKRTLVQRVTNTRFFSLFFSERKYPLFGMERAHAFPGNSGKGGRREKEGETQYKKTR